MAQIAFIYEGNTYKSKKDANQEDMKELVCTAVRECGSFKFNLENGDMLVIGEDALKRGVFVISK